MPASIALFGFSAFLFVIFGFTYWYLTFYGSRGSNISCAWDFELISERVVNHANGPMAKLPIYSLLATYAKKRQGLKSWEPSHPIFLYKARRAKMWGRRKGKGRGSWVATPARQQWGLERARRRRILWAHWEHIKVVNLSLRTQKDF